MNTSAHLTTSRERSSALAPAASPLVLWHLLSLDAPTIAALWTWFAARALHVRLAPAVPLALFLAVWMIYAADRLLDAASTRPWQKSCDKSPEKIRAPFIASLFFAMSGSATNAGVPTPTLSQSEPLEVRHLFHRRHHRPFLAAMSAASILLLALLREIPTEIVHRYLILAALLTLWFSWVHLGARRLPKELVPGAFFAVAVFLPCWTASAPERWHVLVAATAFGCLCTLNCLAIFAWEHEVQTSAHPATRLGLRVRLPLTILLAAACLAIAPAAASPILPAIALAALLLLALDRASTSLERTTLRAAADLALLTPLLVAPWVR